MSPKCIERMFLVNDLEEDVSRNLYISEKVSEQIPVESRSRVGKVLCSKDRLCSFHRLKYGLNWARSRTCQHPLHKLISGRRGKFPRELTVGMCIIQSIR